GKNTRARAKKSGEIRKRKSRGKGAKNHCQKIFEKSRERLATPCRDISSKVVRIYHQKNLKFPEREGTS
ncbi:MAG: hypothetical protein ACLTVB_04195, partial [Sutterella sp.]